MKDLWLSRGDDAAICDHILTFFNGYRRLAKMACDQGKHLFFLMPSC